MALRSNESPLDLHFRARPMPPLDQVDELLRAQLDVLLHQAENDGPNGAELLELFDVLDAQGQHVYDLHLFCGDDGRVHRKGTLEYVASFSQGGATGSNDKALLSALDRAYRAWLQQSSKNAPLQTMKATKTRAKKSKR